VNRTRIVILVLLSLCSGVSVFWGTLAERAAKGRIADFKLVYYNTQCLLRHCDPYSADEVWNVYRAEGNEVPSDSKQRQQILKAMPAQVYLPTTFLFIVPFALLEWTLAHILWMALIAAGFTVAAFLIFQVAAEHASDISFYLICFMLVNSGVLYAGGNAAGVAVSLCVIATWCFLRDRCVLLGIICLGISLAIKPHDAGLIWLYFLLAGKTQRRRAVYSLAVVALVAVPSLIWVHSVAPNWLPELRANLLATTIQGGNADPGPSSVGDIGPGMIIDLQTVISLFRDDPHFYNLVTYLICGPLLLIWAFVTIRKRGSSAGAWYAIAAISCLSIVVAYHRPYDAKLVLLTLPACAMVFGKGGPRGWTGLVLNSAAIVLTSDLPLATIGGLTHSLKLSTGTPGEQLVAVCLGRPIPIILLALGMFYLWIYARESRRHGDEWVEAAA
jgi:Glycosyltransferase family 87